MGKNYNSDGDSDDGSRSRSQTPLAAPTPGFSLEHHDPQSRSGSPNSQRSGSPNSQRSGRSRSGSRRSGSAGSGSRSGSGSRKGGSRSRSGSRHSGSQRSRSGSAASNRSGSGSRHSRSGSRHSQDGNRSGSGSRHSPAGERRSRSVSRKSGRSRSGSAASKRSGSGSGRSRSGSRLSRSGSPHSRRSKSGSHRSRSGSAASNKSGSKGSRSPRSPSGSRKHSPSRSRSASPKSGEKRKKGVISDSGSEAEGSKPPPPKRLGIVDSDSEPEKESEEPKEGVTADAIFGDDVSDISTEDEGEKKDGEDARRSKTPERARSRSRSRSSNDQEFERVYQQLSDEEKIPEAEPEPIPETRIDVEIPRIVSNLGRDIHFVKMPNFLSVETRPFDEETYEDEIDEEDVMDEEGRQRLKLKVGNTIRWREAYNPDGTVRRESNARIVKWSDGSMSLHLGSEIFDVYKQPLTGDHNHLFIRQGTGLQGQAVFRSKLTFRPHSTESFTHKKMTISLADRSQKTSGIKILTQVGHDPDADRYQKLKSEEEKLRQAMRARAGGVTKQPKRSSTAQNASYHDEGSEDEGAISIAAIKGKYKKDKNQKQSASAIYSSDEDGSDIDSRRKKKLGRSKALRALDDEDGGSSDGGTASGSGSASENDDKHNSDNTAEGNDSD